jgi:hypothetical protein
MPLDRLVSGKLCGINSQLLARGIKTEEFGEANGCEKPICSGVVEMRDSTTGCGFMAEVRV